MQMGDGLHYSIGLAYNQKKGEAEVYLPHFFKTSFPIARGVEIPFQLCFLQPVLFQNVVQFTRCLVCLGSDSL
jgi:hypothetical protein